MPMSKPSMNTPNKPTSHQPQDAANFKSKSGIKRIFKAWQYSIQGLKAAIRHEAAFRQELMLCIVLAPLAFFLGQTGFEVLFLLSTLFLLLITELLNSAIEAVADKLSQEYDPLIGRAKDLGSAAVFLCLSLIALVWIYFLLKIVIE